jgi:hypothetical protein
MQGVLFGHGNSLVRPAHWSRAVGSKTRPAIMRKPARAGARAVMKATYRKKTWQEKIARKTARHIARHVNCKTHKLAGSTVSNPANDDLRYQRKLPGLAVAAGSPGRAATADAATSATNAAASASTAASATTATAAPAPGDLDAGLRRRCVFLIENVERRQTYIGDFFFTERDLVTRCNIRSVRHVRDRRDRC